MQVTTRLLVRLSAGFGSFLVCALPTTAQVGGFGSEHVLTNGAASGAQSVYATDLDGDGDIDVLSASYYDDKIAWYKNLGSGSFGVQQVITTAADGATSVYATDLDGDGDADVLSSSREDNKIAWHENLGSGAFGTQQVITTTTQGASSVYATDLDGDGDADVLSASTFDNRIRWYENLGGTFGSPQVISTGVWGASSVYATDLNGDGDADVLSAARSPQPALGVRIAWYENLGSGAFGPQRAITTAASGATSVYATDLDGDGKADALSSSANDGKVAWYKNLGNGAFGPQQVIATAAGAFCVYATDLDDDGQADVLSASSNDDTIAWYKNLGSGSFGAQQVIATAAQGATSVYAADLDGDGDVDVLSASRDDGKVAWYQRLLAATFTTSGQGCAGSFGTPQLAGSGVPQPGASFTVVVQNRPPSQAGFLVTALTVPPVPVALGPYGLSASCLGYVDLQFSTTELLFADAGGVAQKTVAVPNDTALLGLSLYFQDYVLDNSLTSAVPLLVSNLGTAFVGL